MPFKLNRPKHKAGELLHFNTIGYRFIGRQGKRDMENLGKGYFSVLLNTLF